MRYSLSAALFGLAAIPFAAAATQSITPHDSFSSSIGVLGCKINTNRVAYWPGMPDCNNFCKKVTNTNSGQSTYLLHIDSSGGAYDISYDAWVYLQNGGTAAQTPLMGGGINMEVEDAPPSECAHLLDGGKMPFTAQNGANFYTSCMNSNSWIGNNNALYGITNMACTLGVDEICSMTDYGQPVCPSGFAHLNDPLAGHTVYNIQYGTGLSIPAV